MNYCRSLVAAAFAVVCAWAADAQNSQFGFDPHGNLIAELSETPAPPQILTQPQPQVVRPGELASFFVVAADTRALAYQWLYYSTNLPGASADTLLITNASAGNQGPYSVILSNSSGSVTSSIAQFYIDTRGVGMPDSWQLAYFGNLNQNPTGDFDDDGVSNLQEFLDGTNPTNSASALFRLTLLSNGGLIQAVPSGPSYTNGQVVTLTAVPFAPNVFRGWAGDLNSTNNPATVTMTTNKTVFAYLGPFNLTWTNPSPGDWNVATNWSPNFVPGPNDSAFINSAATVSISNSAECASLTLGPGSAPTLAISNSLTLDGPSYWFAGTLTGNGRTIVKPAATLTINNPSSIYVNSGTLENDGTVLWVGANSLTLNNAVFTNSPGALFSAQNAAALTGSSSRFDNAGIFRKTANPGTNILLIPFNNYGTVDLQSGTLQMSGFFTQNGTVALAAGTTNRLAAGSSGTGTFLTTSNSLVEWVGGPFTPAFTLSPGAQLNGPGLYRNNTANLNFNTDLTVQNLDVVTSSASTINGTNLLVISNVMNLVAGSLNSSGRTLIAPGATLNIPNPGTVFLNNGTVENAGTTLWTGFSIQMSGGAVITNRSGTIFEAQATGTLGGSGSRIDNAGTFRKSVNPGPITVFANFNNYGTVDVQTGTLVNNASLNNNAAVLLAAGTSNILSGGCSVSGSFTAAPSAVVMCSGNGFTPPFNFNAGAQLIGGGLYQMFGGIVNLNTDIAARNLDFASTINGTGSLTVSNVMNWFSGGSINGNGANSLVISPGATLNLVNSGTVFMASRTFDNAGTVSWSGAGGMQISGVVVTNRPGALFHIQNDASVSGSGRFDNLGIFRKSTTAGASTVSVAFNNYSTVDLQTGSLTLSGGGGNIAGFITVPAGTTLGLGGTFTSDSASSITGAGNLTVNSGTASLAGLINVRGTNSFNGGTANLTGNYFCTNNTLNIFGTANFDGTGAVGPNIFTLGGTLGGANNVTVGNQMSWTGGTMGGSGRTVIGPGATMTWNSAFTLTLNRSLENAGTATWTGAGCAMTGGIITNRLGALFIAQSSTSLFGSGSRVDNAGTFRKEISSGTTTFDHNVTLNNYGTVEIRTGVVLANANVGYTSSSNSVLNCWIAGTNAGAGYGQLQVASAVTLNGALNVNFANGYLPATNDTFTLVTATSRAGTFSNFLYPSNVVTMTLSNAPNAVIAQISGVLLPRPLLFTPVISGSNVLLTWTAVSNLSYRVEFNSNLALLAWSALAGDVTATSSTASKFDTLTPSNRFYRVRVLP